MKLQPFKLERWLLQPCLYDIASAGTTKLKLKDLTAGLDLEMVMNYGITNGSESIRESIASLYPGIGAQNVLLTSGTAEANFLAVYRILDPDDEVIVLLPTYLQCAGIARSIGAVVRNCCYKVDDGYAPDIVSLKSLVNRKTKLICCVNPNNPTGSVMSPADMHAVCEIAEGVGAWVLCDGALRGLELEGGPAATPAAMYDRGIATGSLSKIGLTGIRIGWMAADTTLIEQCWADKDYTTLCHSGIGEYLAAVALEKENFNRYLQRAKTIAAANRSVLSNWLDTQRKYLKWVPSVAGHTGFVAYEPDIPSEPLCEQLVSEEEVLVGPGDFFGAPKHLRIRYSGEKKELEQALDRFGAFLRRL